jgi:hypothetical protein
MKFWLIAAPCAVVFIAGGCTQDGAHAGTIADAAYVVEGEAGDIADAAHVLEGAVADGPFCPQSLDAFCAMTNAGCVRDWTTALQTAVAAAADGSQYCCRSCGVEKIEVCGGYNVLLQSGADSVGRDYYDATTGKLVAVVGYNANLGTYQCVGGPPNFGPPSCSSSMSLCDLVTDGGAAGG